MVMADALQKEFLYKKLARLKTFLDGVVLIDPDYFDKEGKRDRKVFVQLLAGFRYGREDLDVLGLSFRRELIDERMLVYPSADEPKPQLLTMLQLRLLKKLGKNAYPFTFTLKPGLPSSVTLQPAVSNEGDKPCGVDFILRAYVARNAADKYEKRNSVKLAIKKLTHAPVAQTVRPTMEVSKQFMLSSRPLTVEANLDKGTYYHGEPISVNVSIANASSKTVKKIKITVRQFADICLFAQSKYKCVVCELDAEEGLPLHPGASLQRTYQLVPLLEDNRKKPGLALDGQIKHEDTYLASSTILPVGMEEIREVRENLGVMVHYSVKVRCIVSFGSDVTLELPFTLTHPEPNEKVVCGMVTLPRKPESASGSKEEGKKTDVMDNPTEMQGAEMLAEVPEPLVLRPCDVDTSSVHGLVLDQDLIRFEDEHEQDFVFEEFVRLRISGMDETETDA